MPHSCLLLFLRRQRRLRFQANDFNQWPDACQKRYLQDLDIPLKDLFGWGGKEESPANLSILVKKSLPPNPHGLPDGGSTYAANSMRSAALTSTAKDDDDDPESSGNRKQRRFSVNVSIGLDMSEIPGFVDASQSGGGGDDCSTLKVTISNAAGPGQLSDNELAAMRREMARIYGTIGINLAFPPHGGDYSLNVTSTATRPPTSKNPDMTGETDLDVASGNVKNTGRVYTDRMLRLGRDLNSETKLFWNIMEHTGVSPLGITLGRAGSHEVGHFALQQNFDSPSINGVMRDKHKGTNWILAGSDPSAYWFFTPEQATHIRYAVREMRDCLPPEKPVRRRFEPDW